MNDRTHGTPHPQHLNDYVQDDKLAQLVDVFVKQPESGLLKFNGGTSLLTGHPAYQLTALLTLF